jgi:hypothetical protein
MRLSGNFKIHIVLSYISGIRQILNNWVSSKIFQNTDYKSYQRSIAIQLTEMYTSRNITFFSIVNGAYLLNFKYIYSYFNQQEIIFTLSCIVNDANNKNLSLIEILCMIMNKSYPRTSTVDSYLFFNVLYRAITELQNLISQYSLPLEHELQELNLHIDHIKDKVNLKKLFARVKPL